MLRTLRRRLFIIVLFLLSIGIVMIYSSSAIYAYEKFGDSMYFLKRHLLHIFLGFICMFLTMSIELKTLKKYIKPLLLISILLCIGVFIPPFSRQVAGANRWISIWNFSFQPSEILKICLIMYVAYTLHRKKDRLNDFKFTILPIILISGISLILILLQPDFGTAVLIGMVIIIMFFAGGIKVSYILSFIFVSLPILYFLIFSVDYRRSRITAFLNPWRYPRCAGFQLVQSFLAFGSGGFSGVGLGESRQKLFYLPASHTDFIFSIIGEELGLIGTWLVVFLFIFFILYGLKTCLRIKSYFGRIFCIGFMSLFALEAIVNIGVTTGMFPTKGLPLPFISYGGTNLIIKLAGLGLIFNISRAQEVAKKTPKHWNNP